MWERPALGCRQTVNRPWSVGLFDVETHPHPPFFLFKIQKNSRTKWGSTQPNSSVYTRAARDRSCLLPLDGAYVLLLCVCVVDFKAHRGPCILESTAHFNTRNKIYKRQACSVCIRAQQSHKVDGPHCTCPWATRGCILLYFTLFFYMNLYNVVFNIFIKLVQQFKKPHSTTWGKSQHFLKICWNRMLQMLKWYIKNVQLVY